MLHRQHDDVAAEHGEAAVGEIDEAHQAHGDRQADRDDEQHHAGGEAAEQHAGDVDAEDHGPLRAMRLRSRRPRAGRVRCSRRAREAVRV